MKNPDTFPIRSTRGLFESFSAGETAARISVADTPLLSLGRCRINSFSEASVLPEKHRIHPAQDRLSAEIESIGVIPFGCEFHLRRVWTVMDGIALLHCDVAPDNGGTVAALDLEPVTLPFSPVLLQYLVFGEKELREERSGKKDLLYAGEEPVIFLHAVSPAGEEIDFYAGDDFWRHRAGIRTPQATEHQELLWDDGGVTLTRQLLIPADENTLSEKRPWRFKSCFFWRKKAERSPLAGKAIALEGCFASSAPKKKLRDAVRKSGENCLLSADFPIICRDPAHLDRPGKAELEHGSLGELTAAYLWANRELNKRRAAFAVSLDHTIFGSSAAAANLAEAPARLED